MPVSIGSVDMKNVPSSSHQVNPIRCPDAEDAGMTDWRHGARLTRAGSRAYKLLVLGAAFLLIHQAVMAETTDPKLVPSIFAPESAPAHAISHLAVFVLTITGAIFVVVTGLLLYAVV